jgi:hypothetical protein
MQIDIECDFHVGKGGGTLRKRRGGQRLNAPDNATAGEPEQEEDYSRSA